MRVLYISFDSGLAGPLLHSQILAHVCELSRWGYRFDILTFESSQQSLKEGERCLTIASELANYNARWWRLSHVRAPSPLPSVIGLLKGVVLGTYIILWRRVQVIHARSLVGGILGCLLSWLTRRPWVFDPRILHAEAGALAGRYSWNSHRFKFICWLERRLAGWADGVRVESAQHRESYLQDNRKANQLRARYRVVPNSVDTRRFVIDKEQRRIMREGLGLSSDTIVFVYSGTLGHGRPNRVMAEFVAQYRTFHPRVHFLVLTYTDLALAHRVLRVPGLQSNEMTILSVPFEDVPLHLQAVDVGLAFQDRRAHSHSVPLKFAEYLACGLPVVINAGIGNTQEIIERYRVGVVLKDLSPEELKRGAQELSALLAKGEALRQRCRRAAKAELSLHVAVGKLAKMYRSVANVTA